MGILSDLFSKVIPENKPMPRYRLVPDNDGSYKLEQWYNSVQLYLVEEVGIPSLEAADEIIKNRNRDIIYYRESITEPGVK